jgi:hypothetical protein
MTKIEQEPLRRFVAHRLGLDFDSIQDAWVVEGEGYGKGEVFCSHMGADGKRKVSSFEIRVRELHASLEVFASQSG